MITILLFILLFLCIWHYLKEWINYLKTGDSRENDNNYWMFSYDFKDNKNQEMYWDKNVQLSNKIKRLRNKLIFLLYINAIIIFILVNSLVTKMMIFIFD